MPGYHVRFALFEFRGGQMLYVSTRPGHYAIWRSDAPLYGLDLPITGFRFVRYWAGADDELCLLAASKDANYYAGRIYGNYDGGLDLHLSRAGGDVHFYRLVMPAAPPAGVSIDGAGLWPQPVHWFYATGKVWQCPVSYAEFDNETMPDLFND